MARKVAELETDIVAMYRRLDAAIPAIHKQTRRDASSASESRWVNLNRASCGLVVAAADLGDHCRRAAGIEKPGPIREALDDDALQRIRQQAAGGNADAGDDGTQRLSATLRTIADTLPDRATIQSEVEWVAANLHDPCPALAKAPSRTAVSLLLDARRDERVRREFWTILLTKRLGTGDARPKATPFPEDREAAEADTHTAELIRAMQERLGEISSSPAGLS